MMTGTIDHLIYESEICPWLPPEMIDCHTHVGLRQNCGHISRKRRSQNWALEVGLWQSWDQLRETYLSLFPKQRVSALAFGTALREADFEAENAYVIAGASDSRNDAWALFATRPEWNAGMIEDAMSAGFLGIKPYPDLVPQDRVDVGIYDFVPKEHLKVLDEHSGILMLHLPREGRIGDPDNIRELLEIADRYPSVRLVVAHVGRAYCLPTAQKGLPHLTDATGIYFDTAANLNSDVFQYALETVGPDRLLFGSDLPITMMRGFREHVGQTYTNFTNGPYTWNTNRRSHEEEVAYTYFIYEELRALIRAFRATGLGKDAFRKLMYSNAINLLGIPARNSDSAVAAR